MWPSKTMTNLYSVCIMFGICLLFFYYSTNNGFQLQTSMEMEENLPVRKLLRIAQISAVFDVRELPKNYDYDGIERIVSYLTEELLRRGHQVTLFTCSDSLTFANLVAKWPVLNENSVPPYKTLPDSKWLMNQVKELANEFDILHFHTDSRQIEGADEIFKQNKSGIVFTEHLLNSSLSDKLYKHIPHISISYDQRKHMNAGGKFIANVYYGLPKNLYTFVHKSIEERYLAFMGHISPENAPDWAIEIAVRAGMSLKIAAKADPNDQYWTNEIWPMIEKHKDFVEYTGEINDMEKNFFLGHAYAFLYPINWTEPSGLIMVEAMACGTPVLGRRMGSVFEIVDEGVTGWLFDTTEQAVEAIGKVAKLDRSKVRQTFERRFTAETMADNYENVYYHQKLGIE